ncbi:prelamin-A/C-like isoform X2 [Stegostoma tigrinum]|uniref:prelamin-A/C-like isoform X2 n=1 Tax=Stegostoma tigrinum TaxID=3053191 RepID=UPI002870AF6E|nr:prelamin-A/C-like isoform X2 [Stegostoma tigrinum]
MAECGSIGQKSEKAQLQELNERFCHYIQKVKCMTDQLGTTSDNSNDLKRIQELEEEMVAARNMYNKEIQALHDQLDQNCKERMQIEMNNLKNSQMIAEFRESILALNTAVLQKEEEKKCMELLLCQKEAELRELMNNASNPSSEVDDLKRQLEKIRCNLEDIQRKYEMEHKQNAELQCTVQQLRHKLERQQENHCQDMICMREKAAEADHLIQELEEKLRRPSDDDGGAMKMLQKIREANDAEIKQYQRQTEQAYNQNLMELSMCLNKEHIQLEQIQEENQCLRQHINNLSTEIKMLQTKLLAEEESKVALIDKLSCEQQKNQQRINDLKMRLEEMEDLLLAKMKELSSKRDGNSTSLQGDISAFKCLLESEERRLRDSQLMYQQKCSPCKPYLPTARTSCAPLNQSSCPRVPAASSCPPVNLRPCPPPPISNPCKPLHQSSGGPSSAPSSSLAPAAPMCCLPSSALTTRLPVHQLSCQLPSSLASCLSTVRPNCLSSSCIPPCLPVSRLSCPPPSALALCTSMNRPRCPSPLPMSSCPPPANPSASCRSASSRPCPMTPVTYAKLNNPTDAAKCRLEQYVASECNNTEPKWFFPKPPTHSPNSCKSGQGRDFYNALIKDLNNNDSTSTPLVCKPLMNTCDLNTPIASTMGNMKIIEVAANGHFVRLLNISLNTEEDIGNYILQQNIGGHPVTVYRFPPRTRVNAGSTITVWSAGAKVPHSPPKDFLLKDSNKFGTGPECTTILCKPNGQAVAWFTPAPGNSKLKDPCKDGEQFTDYEHSLPNNNTLPNFQPEKGKEESFANIYQFSPVALPVNQKPSFYNVPARCPWGQSPASPTHPDFNLPRTLSAGNDGSSQCRDSRSQFTRPDPIPDQPYSRLRMPQQCRKNSLSKTEKKSSTCSGAPYHRGVLCMNPSPSASPLQLFYAKASSNIIVPKQGPLGPTALSNL